LSFKFGDVLKIYIIGDNADEIDNAVEIISNKNANIGVIAKEVSSSEQLSKEVANSVSKGYVALLVDDPVGANINLNKLQNVNAVPCSSKEDVYAAKRNNANAIIIKDFSRKEEILSALIEYNSEKKEEKPRKRRIERPKEVEGDEAKESKEEELSKESGKNEETEAVSESEESGAGDEGEEADGEEKEAKHRKGLFENMKDALGIIDKKGD
jgi:ribose 5-phosphate isomerase RpiB